MSLLIDGRFWASFREKSDFLYFRLTGRPPEWSRLNGILLCLFPALFLSALVLRSTPVWIGPVSTEVLREPAQTSISSAKPIEQRRESRILRFHPLYEYDIAGVVVADWKSPLRVGEPDFHNVGLVWGDNVAAEVWKDYAFTINFYTLYPQPRNAFAPGALHEDQLSHNHLIEADEKVLKKIMSISKWDQVRIRGKLVETEYFDLKGVFQGKRGTSTVRNDNGCECIYVEDVEFLGWRKPVLDGLAAAGLYGGFALIALNAIFFVAMKEPSSESSQ